MSRIEELRAELEREEALNEPAVITIGEWNILIEHINTLKGMRDMLGVEFKGNRPHSIVFCLKTIEALKDRIEKLEAQAIEAEKRRVAAAEAISEIRSRSTDRPTVLAGVKGTATVASLAAAAVIGDASCHTVSKNAHDHIVAEVKADLEDVKKERDEAHAALIVVEAKLAELKSQRRVDGRFVNVGTFMGEELFARNPVAPGMMREALKLALKSREVPRD